MSIFLKDGTIFITICWHLIILSGFSEIEFLNCRAPAKGAGKTKKNETQITSQDNPLTPPAFQSACVAPVYCRCRLINTIGSTWAQCALQTPSELSCQRGFPLQTLLRFWLYLGLLHGTRQHCICRFLTHALSHTAGNTEYTSHG